ncbi:hypothetical protein HYH03_011970 [Edaphochlamys debaryana]|uniref:Uncharacterized protein n=1 Tax=Edaphochlamys debaryana TaxID=47281 RepID=A0A836BVY1_9CHLO|nr:hypothetical protein HYH03_011970 [Edaphochlamys debaryana]|eukprot:KAG2489519.1 hypothetical protein HYH03_011970 [Edaphochlamys debaryana]
MISAHPAPSLHDFSAAAEAAGTGKNARVSITKTSALHEHKVVAWEEAEAELAQVRALLKKLGKGGAAEEARVLTPTQPVAARGAGAKAGLGLAKGTGTGAEAGATPATVAVAARFQAA